MVPCTVFAAEQTGWIEVRVDVPADFKANIIVGIQDTDTYEDYALRVMAVNNYVARCEVPAGKYKVVGAFLESGDYRYNTVLVGGPTEFEITGREDAAAILLEFKTTFNEEYSEGADITPETQPAPETQATEPPMSSEPDQEVTVPASDDEPVTEGTEATEASTDETNDSEEEDPGLPFWKRMVYAVLGTGVFVGVVLLAAYFYRRHLGFH